MRFLKYYQWLMPSLLFSSALVVFRVLFLWNPLYISMLWNLFLAILPLYFSFKASRTLGKKAFWAWSAMWLLFFPNAMYITTDMFHLNEHAGIPKWFDLIMLSSCAINGLAYGVLSLRNMEKRMRDVIPQKYLNAVLLFIMMLCGYGVYLGRYLRWNSWDVVTNPISLAGDMYQHIVHPFRNANIWALTITFGTWMYILYKFFKRLEKR